MVQYPHLYRYDKIWWDMLNGMIMEYRNTNIDRRGENLKPMFEKHHKTTIMVPIFLGVAIWEYVATAQENRIQILPVEPMAKAQYLKGTCTSVFAKYYISYLWCVIIHKCIYIYTHTHNTDSFAHVQHVYECNLIGPQVHSDEARVALVALGREAPGGGAPQSSTMSNPINSTNVRYITQRPRDLPKPRTMWTPGNAARRQTTGRIS